MKKRNAILTTLLILIGMLLVYLYFGKEHIYRDTQATMSTGTQTETKSQTNAQDILVGVITDVSSTLDTYVKAHPTVELVMVGDMLMHTRVLDSGRMADGSLNYSHLFTQVKGKIQSADIALVNQETILGGTELGLSTYPSFNSPFEVGDAEVEAGFDVVLHATNHTLDKYKKGLTNCLNYWATSHPEMTILGIHDSKESRDTIYVYEKDGIKIAILNYTYGTNGREIPSDMPYAIDLLTEQRVREDTAKARELADFIVVCPHWGTEYQLTPDNSQKRWCKLFLECGVDLVIGTHPHVIEPVEMYTDDNGQQMLVYYSLGNFVNGTESVGNGIGVRMVGGMADVRIGRDANGKVSILNYQVIPLVCHEDEGTGYTVYFLSDYTDELGQRNWIRGSDPEFSKAFCDEIVNQVWGINLEQ